jgi:hypothetical protein
VYKERNAWLERFHRGVARAFAFEENEDGAGYRIQVFMRKLEPETPMQYTTNTLGDF